MLILYTILFAFIGAWLSEYLKVATLYLGALGKLKYNLLKRYFDEDDQLIMDDIINSRELRGFEVNEQVEDLYANLSSRCKLAYFLSCSYCMGTWIFSILFFANLIFGITDPVFYIVINYLFGISLIAFFLNFVKNYDELSD